MMEAIRKGASSWIVKVLIIAPLILAFAVWGIEDMLRGPSQGAIAEVGDQEISQEAFQQSYNAQINALSQRFRQRITPQQAQSLGLPNQVAERLVQAAAVDQHAKQLGLALSEEALVRELRKDPLFQDSSGNFDRGAFQSLLFNADMTEQQFFEERRKDTLRDHLTQAMIDAVHVPDELVTLTHIHQNETRKVAYVRVPRTDPATIDAPDEAELKAWYEARKAQYQTPEYRAFSLLQIMADDVRKAIDVTDAEIKQQYEARRSALETPERRRIQQIPFDATEAAKAARAEIVAGKDFADVAKDAGLSDSEINLGLLSKEEMIDSKVADAAFALDENAVSDVIEGDFKTFIVRVTEIQDGETKSLDEVRDQMRTEVANTRLGVEIQRIHDLVDEARLAGTDVAKIAEDLKISYRQIEAVDRQGRSPDGETVINGSDAERILNIAFEAIVGVENEVIERTDRGYAWVDLQSITKPKQQTFEEVKDDVAEAWRRDQANADLRARAQKLVDRMAGGESLEAIAKDAELELQTSEPFKRNERPQGLPPAAVAQAFTLDVNGGSNALAPGNEARVVFQVIEIAAPTALDDDARETEAERLRAELQSDIIQQYLTKLQADIGVTINDAAVRRAVGLDVQ